MASNEDTVGPTQPTNSPPLCNAASVLELFQLAADEIRDAEHRQRLLTHLEGCPVCKRWYDNARRTFGNDD